MSTKTQEEKMTVIPKDKADSIMVTAHFKASEFSCKCSNKECEFTYIKKSHVDKLEVFRQKLIDYFGFKIHLEIHSANRCKKRNAEVGGKPASEHLTPTSTATDLGIKKRNDKGNWEPIKITPEIVEMAKDIFDGVGYYKKLNFVHCDSRGSKVYWEGF